MLLRVQLSINQKSQLVFLDSQSVERRRLTSTPPPPFFSSKVSDTFSYHIRESEPTKFKFLLFTVVFLPSTKTNAH
ncbi:hypothetical protein T07_7058 [Trichinella nelsoni]|uniref:Uncharacterized protein n=1 Tax=Trichinella nelsoni TaxID=6336 RepID=A0A0V0SDY9_9BILA|nr:hypothetical protein T07_7058 [Trichinella nelsoni]